MSDLRTRLGLAWVVVLVWITATAGRAQDKPDPRSSFLSGVVEDVAGEPVSGATVEIRIDDLSLPPRVGGWLFDGFETERIVADERGLFLIRIDPTRLHGLRAFHPDGRLSNLFAPAVPGRLTRLVLRDPVELHGTVRMLGVAPRPVPCADAEVRAIVEPTSELSPTMIYGRSMSELAVTRTDADGTFRVIVPAGTPAHLLASADGRVEIVTVGADAATPIELDLGSPITVHGRVVDAEDEPLSGMLVRWMVPASFGGGVETDEDGKFVLPRMRAMPLLEVRGGDRGPQAMVVEAVHTPFNPLVIRMPAGATVRARLLRADGSPLAGHDVVFRGGAGSAITMDVSTRARTTDDGRVAYRGATAERPVSGWVEIDGTWVRFAHRQLDTDVDLGDCMLRPDARLEGQVVDVDGTPAAAATVLVLPAEDGEEPMDGFDPGADARMALTDHGGRFIFRGLLRGEYLVLVVSSHSLPTVVSAAASAKPVVSHFELRAARTIKGIVRAADGEPVSNAIVHAMCREDSDDVDDSIRLARNRFGLRGGDARSDDHGRFMVSCYDSESVHHLFASKFDSTPMSGSVDEVNPGDDAVEIVLERNPR